jgi:hypothetical protein
LRTEVEAEGIEQAVAYTAKQLANPHGVEVFDGRCGRTRVYANNVQAVTVELIIPADTEPARKTVVGEVLEELRTSGLINDD